jgi:hypothetical protein
VGLSRICEPLVTSILNFSQYSFVIYSINHRMSDVVSCPVSFCICSSSVMVNSSGFFSLSLLPVSWLAVFLLFGVLDGFGLFLSGAV